MGGPWGWRSGSESRVLLKESLRFLDRHLGSPVGRLVTGGGERFRGPRSRSADLSAATRAYRGASGAASTEVLLRIRPAPSMPPAEVDRASATAGVRVLEGLSSSDVERPAAGMVRKKEEGREQRAAHVRQTGLLIDAERCMGGARNRSRQVQSLLLLGARVPTFEAKRHAVALGVDWPPHRIAGACRKSIPRWIQ